MRVRNAQAKTKSMNRKRQGTTVQPQPAATQPDISSKIPAPPPLGLVWTVSSCFSVFNSASNSIFSGPSESSWNCDSINCSWHVSFHYQKNTGFTPRSRTKINPLAAPFYLTVWGLCCGSRRAAEVRIHHTTLWIRRSRVIKHLPYLLWDTFIFSRSKRWWSRLHDMRQTSWRWGCYVFSTDRGIVDFKCNEKKLDSPRHLGCHYQEIWLGQEQLLVFRKQNSV